VIDHCWDASRELYNNHNSSGDFEPTVHGCCGAGVDLTLKACAAKRTLDNITAVIVGFEHFETALKKSNEPINIQGDQPTFYSANLLKGLGSESAYFDRDGEKLLEDSQMSSAR
jgi:hypothetical protein